MSTTKAIGIISLIFVVFMAIGVVGWGLQAAMLGPKTVTTQIDSAGQVIEACAWLICGVTWLNLKHRCVWAIFTIPLCS